MNGTDWYTRFIYSKYIVTSCIQSYKKYKSLKHLSNDIHKKLQYKEVQDLDELIILYNDKKTLLEIKRYFKIKEILK